MSPRRDLLEIVVAEQVECARCAVLAESGRIGCV
jgi:hypothetical protein